MDKELIVYGASDDLVEFDGAYYEEYDAYGAWFGQVNDANGEHIRLYISYGEENVEWKLRAENPFGWDIRIGERPDREGDPAFFIYTPTGDITVEVLDELWDNPKFDVTAQ